MEMDEMARRTAVKLSESNTTSFFCSIGRDSDFFSEAADECIPVFWSHTEDNQK